MSWRDRDWAKESPPTASYWRGQAGGGKSYSIVTVLIAINVGVFAVSALSPGLRDFIYGYGMLVPLDVFRGQIWRLITAQYLHAGTFHILVNMIALHFLGRPLEERWSHRKFFWVYTVCGLCGNIFYTVLAGRGVIPLMHAAVGASGCIYGLLGIVAVLFPRATVYIYFLFPVRIRTAAIVLGAIAFLTVAERGRNYGGQACHLAGLVFGVWWALHGEEWWSNTKWFWQRPRK